MTKKKKQKKAKSSKSAAKSGKPEKLPRNVFDKELRVLQTELCHLQEYVKREGLRIIVVFEGRDAAGKGGVIKRITERVSPRVFRVVALPAPPSSMPTSISSSASFCRLSVTARLWSNSNRSSVRWASIRLRKSIVPP